MVVAASTAHRCGRVADTTAAASMADTPLMAVVFTVAAIALAAADSMAVEVASMVAAAASMAEEADSTVAAAVTVVVTGTANLYKC